MNSGSPNRPDNGAITRLLEDATMIQETHAAEDGFCRECRLTLLHLAPHPCIPFTWAVAVLDTYDDIRSADSTPEVSDTEGRSSLISRAAKRGNNRKDSYLGPSRCAGELTPSNLSTTRRCQTCPDGIWSDIWWNCLGFL